MSSIVKAIKNVTSTVSKVIQSTIVRVVKEDPQNDVTVVKGVESTPSTPKTPDIKIARETDQGVSTETLVKTVDHSDNYIVDTKVQNAYSARDHANAPSEREKNRIKITVMNLLTRSKIDLYATPDSFDDAYTANFVEKAILGRSQPLEVYTGGSSRTLSFSVTIHEDFVMAATGKDLLDYCDKVKAMSYPVYSNGVKVPRVYCRVGKLFSFWGFVNTSISFKGPYRDQHPIMADISFTFTRIAAVNKAGIEVTERPIDANWIEEKGYDRSSKNG